MIGWPPIWGALGYPRHSLYTGTMLGYTYNPSAVSLSNTQTVAVPSGVSVGDTLIAIVKHPLDLILPAGWTLCLTDAQITARTPNNYISFAVKTVAAGDPASYTFTTSTTERFIVDIVAFSGALEFVDYAARSNVTESYNPNVYTSPSIEADAGGLVITAFQWARYSTAYTNTQRLVIDSYSSHGGTWAMCSMSSNENSTSTNTKFLMGAAYAITSEAGSAACNFRFYSGLINSISNGVGIVTARFRAK